MKICDEQVTKFRFLMLHGPPGPVRATSQKRTVLSFAVQTGQASARQLPALISVLVKGKQSSEYCQKTFVKPMEVNEAKVDSLFGHQPVESDVKLEPSEQGNLLKGIDKKTVRREGKITCKKWFLFQVEIEKNCY